MWTNFKIMIYVSPTSIRHLSQRWKRGEETFLTSFQKQSQSRLCKRQTLKTHTTTSVSCQPPIQGLIRNCISVICHPSHICPLPHDRSHSISQCLDSLAWTRPSTSWMSVTTLWMLKSANCWTVCPASMVRPSFPFQWHHRFTNPGHSPTTSITAPAQYVSLNQMNECYCKINKWRLKGLPSRR